MGEAAHARCTAFAPASVGNVGVGFDLLGHGFPAVGDRVTALRRERPGVEIESLSQVPEDIPMDPARNTAGRAAQAVIERAGVDWGVVLRVEKGVPVGAGMGGSGASAVAAAVAVNGLLAEPLPQPQVLDCALQGEEVATGARVTDNVAASLLGGLVFSVDGDPPLAVRLPVPKQLYCSLVYPALQIRTRESRQALASQVPLEIVVRQNANLAGVLTGCQRGDWDMLARFLRDVMIEPQRCGGVRGFDQVRLAAMQAGALGVSLSGSGPSMFAWARGLDRAEAIRRAMSRAFDQQQISNRAWVCPVASEGALILERA